MKDGTKLRLLYLYQYITNNSDEKHPLTTRDMTKMLQDEHGMTVNRMTLANDLNMLLETGAPIRVIRGKEKSYYYEGRKMSIEDLNILANITSTSRLISRKKRQMLIRKLGSLTTSFETFEGRRNVVVSDLPTEVSDVMDIINEAINLKRKITFQYTEYTANKERVLRRKGKSYIVSPYTLAWDSGYCYVIGHSQARDCVQNFRLDRIYRKPTITDEKIVPAPIGFDKQKYVESMVRMFGGKEKTEVTLLCRNDVMNSMIDHFGIQTKVSRQDEEHFTAQVQVALSPTFYRWVFGFAGGVSILAPEEARKELRTMCEKVMETL
ncbi:MAG: WYL domain-containing protein [Clostridia bacterium]|nr:WYL domain-containing protein [Clostridia bacterium]